MSKSDKIIKWLNDRPLIKINKLFVMAGMDSGNATRNWQAGVIPDRFIQPIEKQLSAYGYKKD